MKIDAKYYRIIGLVNDKIVYQSRVLFTPEKVLAVLMSFPKLHKNCILRLTDNFGKSLDFKK